MNLHCLSNNSTWQDDQQGATSHLFFFHISKDSFTQACKPASLHATRGGPCMVSHASQSISWIPNPSFPSWNPSFSRGVNSIICHKTGNSFSFQKTQSAFSGYILHFPPKATSSLEHGILSPKSTVIGLLDCMQFAKGPFRQLQKSPFNSGTSMKTFLLIFCSLPFIKWRKCVIGVDYRLASSTQTPSVTPSLYKCNLPRQIMKTGSKSTPPPPQMCHPNKCANPQPSPHPSRAANVSWFFALYQHPLFSADTTKDCWFLMTPTGPSFTVVVEREKLMENVCEWKSPVPRFLILDVSIMGEAQNEFVHEALALKNESLPVEMSFNEQKAFCTHCCGTYLFRCHFNVTQPNHQAENPTFFQAWSFAGEISFAAWQTKYFSNVCSH